jgi:hypothetical protein
MQGSNGLVARYNYFGAFATMQSRVARDVAGQSVRVRCVALRGGEGGLRGAGEGGSRSLPGLTVRAAPSDHIPPTNPTNPTDQVAVEIVDRRAALAPDGRILNATQGGPYNVTVVLRGVGVPEMNAGEAPVIGVADSLATAGEMFAHFVLMHHSCTYGWADVAFASWRCNPTPPPLTPNLSTPPHPPPTPQTPHPQHK